MSNEREYEAPETNDLEDDILFEENLLKKVEARNKKEKRVKKEVEPKYHLDPDILNANLTEHVIMRGINPDHVMSRALGLNVMQLVYNYAESGQFRSYYNGWKDDMKCRAHEHICRYAHGYDINYVKTIEFLLRWLFRKKVPVLSGWLADRGISYTKFYKTLLEVKIPTPNGKEKSKIGRKIFVSDLIKLNDPIIKFGLLFRDIDEEGNEIIPDIDPSTLPVEVVYNPDTFRDEIFSKWPEALLTDFEEQVRRNPFNYLTKYAYNAFIAVIKEEKAISDNSQSYEDKMKYSTDSADNDGMGEKEDRYSHMDIDRLDWSCDITT